jgi:hypothetical protein
MTSTAIAGVAVPLRMHRKNWLGSAWNVAVYSTSRLALNVTPNLLTLLVVRLFAPAEARGTLVALVVATFLTNTAATWLELVLYRYPVGRVGGGVRRVLIGESALVFGVLAFSPAAWAGTNTEPGFALRLLLAMVIVPDLIYRAGAAALQIAGQDRLWIRLNLARVVIDVTAAGAAAFTGGRTIALVFTLATVRVLFGVLIVRLSPLFQIRQSAQRDVAERWIRYGVSASLWITILQVLVYLPQFMAMRFASVMESTAFLAAFRIFFQTSLLMTGTLLLYVHPKLFHCFQTEGSEAFLAKWSSWLPRYALMVGAFAAACALFLPILVPVLLTDKYGGQSTAMLYLLPGIVSLSLANYVQKLLEVREQMVAMAIYLAVAAIAFVIVVAAERSLHPQGQFSITICAGLSFSLTLYLLLVSIHAFWSRPVMSAMVLNATRLIGIGAGATLIGLTGALARL